MGQLNIFVGFAWCLKSLWNGKSEPNVHVIKCQILSCGHLRGCTKSTRRFRRLINDSLLQAPNRHRDGATRGGGESEDVTRAPNRSRQGTSRRQKEQLHYDRCNWFTLTFYAYWVTGKRLGYNLCCHVIAVIITSSFISLSPSRTRSSSQRLTLVRWNFELERLWFCKFMWLVGFGIRCSFLCVGHGTVFANKSLCKRSLSECSKGRVGLFQGSLCQTILCHYRWQFCWFLQESDGGNVS